LPYNYILVYYNSYSNKINTKPINLPLYGVGTSVDFKIYQMLKQQKNRWRTMYHYINCQSHQQETHVHFNFLKKYNLYKILKRNGIQGFLNALKQKYFLFRKLSKNVCVWSMEIKKLRLHILIVINQILKLINKNESYAFVSNEFLSMFDGS